MYAYHLSVGVDKDALALGLLQQLLQVGHVVSGNQNALRAHKVSEHKYRGTNVIFGTLSWIGVVWTVAGVGWPNLEVWPSSNMASTCSSSA